MDNFKRIYKYYGQRTQEWFNDKKGNFSSSEFYRLFGQVTKTEKIKAAIEGLDSGTLKIQGIELDEVTNENMNEVWKFLNPGISVTVRECKEMKKNLKEHLAGDGGVLSTGSARVLDIIIGSNLVNPIPKASMTYIKEKQIEISYDRIISNGGGKSTEWGEEYEPVASRYFFQNNPFFYMTDGYIQGTKELSLCKIDGLAAVISPDDTEKHTIPSEYKCPENPRVHGEHCELKTDLDLLAYCPQKYYQIHGQIWGLGAEKGYWSSYDDRLIGRKGLEHRIMHTIVVERNEELCKRFTSRLEQATQIRDKMVAEFRAK